MKKIMSFVITALACFMFFSCSMDSKMKESTWTATQTYSVYNKDTAKFDQYNVNFELYLDGEFCGNFDVVSEKPEDKPSVHMSIKWEIGSKDGSHNDFLYCQTADSLLEFEIVDMLNPKRHYELKLNDSVYGYISLVEKE